MMWHLRPSQFDKQLGERLELANDEVGDSPIAL